MPTLQFLESADPGLLNFSLPLKINIITKSTLNTAKVFSAMGLTHPKCKLQNCKTSRR